MPLIRGLARIAIPLLATTLAVLAALAPPRQARDLVDVEVVPLNPLDAAQVSVGRLRYRGGIWLRSADPRFGGLSDLRVDGDRARFVAVSDCGNAFEAALAYDHGGVLIGLQGPRFTGLRGLDGRALGPDEIDAEGLARDGAGGFIVSLEGRHHVWRYAAPNGLQGTPTPLPAPAAMAECEPNAGIEAMTDLPGGRLLLIAEGTEAGRPQTTPGWVGVGPQWATFSYPLYYDPGVPDAPFRPTSIAPLPGSDDVLVLERRYPPVAGRIRRVARAAFESGVGLEGVQVARFDPPLTTDNFEAIDAVLGPNGETLVYLLSDDNNCAKTPGAPRRSRQRTLLLLFEL